MGQLCQMDQTTSDLQRETPHRCKLHQAQTLSEGNRSIMWSTLGNHRDFMSEMAFLAIDAIA